MADYVRTARPTKFAGFVPLFCCRIMTTGFCI